ncbi:hypothetical protein [Clostridium polynesiense]|uniref:hypothetical protein n=1 Tax=Clostridium polynesiense TaxID=1325933 RepID=UPI00058FA434|nr:hypothetical protein [Clostridium polynesiense]
MKKIRFLLLVMTLALMMSGVGYAAWSDNLNIQGIIRTGELDVRFAEDDTGLEVRGSKYVNPSMSIIDKSEKPHNLQLSLDNMYPGSWAMFKIKGINSGTIPAKFEKVKVDFSGDKNLLSYLSFEGGVSIDTQGDGKIDKTAYFKGPLSDLQEIFNKAIEKELKNISMNPKNSGYFLLGVPVEKALDIEKKGIKDDYIIIRMDEKAPDEMKQKALNFKLEISFNQYND